jgi:hypothetical protein
MLYLSFFQSSEYPLLNWKEYVNVVKYLKTMLYLSFIQSSEYPLLDWKEYVNVVKYLKTMLYLRFIQSSVRLKIIHTYTFVFRPSLQNY